MNPSDPIGVFDSGVGGLSVLTEIRRELPHEDLIYVADSAFAPYGDKTPAEVAARASQIADILVARGVKAIVVACNTATGAAVQGLRARLALPIIAMEPAVKPAIELTRTGVIGVLATSQTLASQRFVQLLGRLDRRVKILVQPCPGLVERVEAGELADPPTRELLRRYLSRLLGEAVDTIVLGCTHYPHLTPLIEEIVGSRIVILDSGAAVARQVRRRLTERKLLRAMTQPGREAFWTSGEPSLVFPIVKQLWATADRLDRLPESSAAVLADRRGPGTDSPVLRDRPQSAISLSCSTRA